MVSILPIPALEHLGHAALDARGAGLVLVRLVLLLFRHVSIVGPDSHGEPFHETARATKGARITSGRMSR